MRLSFPVALLLLWVFAVSSVRVCHGEEQAAPISPADVSAKASELMGTVVTVSGTIDRLEKDGLSNAAFILVLDGNLRCRLSKEPFQTKNYSGKPRKVELKSVSQGDFGLYVDGVRFLSNGEDIIIRGTLKTEMKKLVLNNASIWKTGNADLRSLLRLPFSFSF